MSLFAKENHKREKIMKSVKKISLILGVMLLFSGASYAQNDLRIPLSNPNSPGKLSVNSVYADEVIIKAWDGKEVRVVINGEDEDYEDAYNRNGLRKISTGGAGVEVTEENNQVNVKTTPNHDDVNLEIWVPEMFSVMVNLTHGDIYVEGVNGEHAVKATNGDVEMIGIRGSVLCNSINGDIEVELLEVTSGAPMSFNGLNGDIEVSLPSDAKFNGKMKTDYGDVYTNFDFNIDRTGNTTESSGQDGVYSITVNRWITGTVNGGGPEYLFKTLHGDIEISKN